MIARSRVGVAFWEVLVVLAIIAALIAIFFPVFMKPRMMSKHSYSLTRCRSNEKQLGLGIIQYAQDADENFPPGVTPTGNGWAGQIYSYIKNVAPYHCPDDSATGHYISYAANQNLLKQTLAQLSNPAATVALYETTTLNCDPATAETVSGVGLAAPQNSNRHDSQNHSLNFLAVDGHVFFLAPNQVSFGPNAALPKTIQNRVGKPINLTFAVK